MSMEGGGMTEIGEIPEEWEIKKIGDIAETSSGGTPSRDKKEYFIGSIPWIKSGELKDNTIYDTEEKITEKGLQNSSAKLFPKGTLLIALYGATVGKTGILGIDATTNQAVCAILSKKDLINQKFLQYFLISRRKQLISLSAGGAQPNISQEIIRVFKIPLPPLPEQRRIAEVLGTVDSAIQKVGGAIERTERLKKGLMQRLLTRGIGHERFKESEVGRVPEEWEVVRLGDVADDFVGGGTPSTSNPDYWNGKISWMTSAHISGRVVTSGQRYITEKGLNESSTHLVPHGNLLVATRVGIGKAATNSIDIAISQDLTGVIIKKDKIIADYAYWFLINNSSRLKSLAQGSTIKGILKDDLTNLKLPLPPLPEQRRIAGILSAADRKLELERRRKEKLERVKMGLMNELLTGRKRIKTE